MLNTASAVRQREPPFNLRGGEPRNRIERLARLADTTLPGIELVRMQNLLTEVLKDERIDPDRVGMWGLSLGGLATMFWMPLEERIRGYSSKLAE